jgi:hypothetical protein
VYSQIHHNVFNNCKNEKYLAYIYMYIYHLILLNGKQLLEDSDVKKEEIFNEEMQSHFLWLLK